MKSNLQRIDAENLPFKDNYFDIVYSWGVIHHSEDTEQVVKEIYRILKPGGHFLISDIISEIEVPEIMKNNKELWGECVSGALYNMVHLDDLGVMYLFVLFDLHILLSF